MGVRKILFELNRNITGTAGIGIRYAILKSMAFYCGENVAIFPGTYICNPEHLCIGDNVSIQPMAYIECGNGDETKLLTIGDDVSIAHGVTIMNTTHIYWNNGKNNIIKDNGIKILPVTISDNVWVGAKATILAGVNIASGCVIGANAVVTKSTEENGVYVGNPAIRIKDR